MNYLFRALIINDHAPFHYHIVASSFLDALDSAICFAGGEPGKVKEVNLVDEFIIISKEVQGEILVSKS